MVDDHDLVRMGISRMLGDVPGLSVVGEADCGENAVTRARELKPDVVLMDVRMPGIGGLEATRTETFDREILYELGELGFLNNLLLHIAGHDVVAIELHREAALAAGHAGEIPRVGGHFG